MTSPVPTKSALLDYSFIALPLAFAGLPLYIYAPDFYVRDLGLNLGLIGVILLVIRLFDAFQDPLIGYISDKHAPKRLEIITWGAIFLITGMAALFYGPQYEIPAAPWFAISMILATTGFSIVTININMIGGFWHSASTQRTRISAWREGFALVGLLVASTLPAILQSMQPNAEAFKTLFWVFAGIMMMAFILFRRFMRQIPPDHAMSQSKTQKGFSFFPLLFGQNKHFFGVCFLTHLAAAIPGVMLLFFIRDYLDAENFAGLFLLLYFLSGALLIAVWVKLAKRIGKEKAWFFSMVLSIVTFIGAYFLNTGDVTAYAIICILSGTALGADLALPPSILADRVSAQKTQNEATQSYAVLAFIPKTAIAIASGVAFIILGQVGFIAGGENSDETLKSVITLYALVPCVIKLFAAIYLWWLNNNEGKLNEKTERTISHEPHNIS